MKNYTAKELQAWGTSELINYILELQDKLSTFALPLISNIETSEQAQNLAIAWQYWFGEHSISYAELAEYQDYFTRLAKKYDLTEEFKENGII